MDNKDKIAKSTLILNQELLLQPSNLYSNSSNYDASFVYFYQKFNENNTRIDLGKLIDELDLKRIKQKCYDNHIDYDFLDEIEKDDLKLTNLHKGLIVYLVYGCLNLENKFHSKLDIKAEEINFENFHFYLTYSGILPVSFHHLYLTFPKSYLNYLKTLINYLFSFDKQTLIRLCTQNNPLWKNKQDDLRLHNWVSNKEIIDNFDDILLNLSLK